MTSGGWEWKLVGGIFTSFVLELLVYPAIYEVWRWSAHAVAQRPERDSAVLQWSSTALNVDGD